MQWAVPKEYIWKVGYIREDAFFVENNMATVLVGFIVIYHLSVQSLILASSLLI